MTLLIMLLGALLFLTGITLMINPARLYGFMKNNADKLMLHIFAIAVRLALGLLLVYNADDSKYPLAIEIIGWISILAAVILAVIGRTHFKRLLYWALSLKDMFAGIAGAITLCFGAFLLYSFL